MSSLATFDLLPIHYQINFKITLLFIDTWINDAVISIQDDDGNVYFQWNYNNYGTVGEFLCGNSDYDYILPLNASWNHTNRNIKNI